MINLEINDVLKHLFEDSVSFVTICSFETVVEFLMFEHHLQLLFLLKCIIKKYFSSIYMIFSESGVLLLDVVESLAKNSCS